MGLCLCACRHRSANVRTILDVGGTACHAFILPNGSKEALDTLLTPYMHVRMFVCLNRIYVGRSLITVWYKRAKTNEGEDLDPGHTLFLLWC